MMQIFNTYCIVTSMWSPVAGLPRTHVITSFAGTGATAELRKPWTKAASGQCAGVVRELKERRSSQLKPKPYEGKKQKH